MAPNTTEGPHKTPHTDPGAPPQAGDASPQIDRTAGEAGAVLPDLSSLVVQAKVVLSKAFPPAVDEIRFGRYLFRALPCSHGSSEAVLVFSNSPDEHGSSNPQVEAAFVCQLFALLTEGRCRTSDFRIAGLNVSTPPQKQSPSEALFLGVIQPEGLENLLQRAVGLGGSLGTQYLRAARAYSSAIDLIPDDPTFAFFLLTTAIECLSTQDSVIPFAELAPEGHTCERFCLFVKTYLPPDARGEDEKDASLLVELLKEIYYNHRSAFTHGGKEVSGASLHADVLASSYFKHSVDGKVRKTPGLRWFAWVTRASLLGFLLSRDSAEPNQGFLARLALESGKIEVKFKKAVAAHHLVMGSDIEYR